MIVRLPLMALTVIEKDNSASPVNWTLATTSHFLSATGGHFRDTEPSQGEVVGVGGGSLKTT